MGHGKTKHSTATIDDDVNVYGHGKISIVFNWKREYKNLLTN